MKRFIVWVCLWFLLPSSALFAAAPDPVELKQILAADLKSLELLYDYTKFHIGLYLSITSAFVAVASVKRGETFAFDLGRGYVWLAVVAFMVAGFAGGVIASSITQCLGLEQSTILQRCSSAQDFLAMRLGPMEVAWFYGRTWTQIEHVAFWIGLVLAAVSFLTGQPAATAVKAPLEVKVSGPVELRNVA